MVVTSSDLLEEAIAQEVERRRNFAIISHPDAGKTTLTEKLLLYGGAIQEAGAVKAKKTQRSATSDWMALEQQRGISITSTVLQFEYHEHVLNLLDTPGHQDFSEDTYRTLAAADNAVMLIDAAKGLETQTRKLFEVCRLRRLPIFTFINKLDRPSMAPFELMDEIEQELGMATYAVNYPIGTGDQFRGLFERRMRQIHLFQRTAAHGSKKAADTVVALGNSQIEPLIDQELYYQFKEELEILEGAGASLDLEAIHKGEMTPVFFGSAMNNFGVELFLQSFLDYAAKPEAYNSSIGDTVYTGEKLLYPPIPSFSPELFAYLKNADPTQYKNFNKGVAELQEEGAVQILHSIDESKRDPILAAVGQLQFEVVQFRLAQEYGVETCLEMLPFSVARWVMDSWVALDKVGRIFNSFVVKDRWERPVLLFKNQWNLQQVMSDHPDFELSLIGLPPVAN